MNPAMLAKPGLMETAMRSFAVNVPLAASLVGAIAFAAWLVDWPTDTGRRRAFLKSLGASKAPHPVFLQYAAYEDPIAEAKAALGQAKDPEIDEALRAAITATF